MEMHPDIKNEYMQQKRAEVASKLVEDIKDIKVLNSHFRTAQIIVGAFTNHPYYGRVITDLLNEVAKEELALNYPYTDSLFSETKEQYSKLFSHLHGKGYITYDWNNRPRILPTPKFRKELEEITKSDF